MKKVLLTVFVGLMMTSPVYALQKPGLSTLDRRIEYVTYDENEVYSIHAINGLISTVIFAPDEEVLSYGSGFSTAWEFASRGNHFFLKPKGKEGTTNLVVVTNKRTYIFDVRLGWNRAKATYRLTFKYPKDEAQKAIAQAREYEVKSLLEQSNVQKSDKPKDVTLNWDYTMNFGSHRLSKTIAPIQAYDDGEFTYLKFAQTRDFPVVYQALEEEQEELLNSHVEGDVLVIHGIYETLRLRAGQAVVGVYNESFTGNGKSSSEGVTIPGLAREIKGE